MKFAVFTHVDHFSHNGKYYAYAPYVREMNLWFKYVEEIEIVAPLTFKEITQEIPYAHDRIKFRTIPSINFKSLRSTIVSIGNIPGIFLAIAKAMKRADHLHLRCPGNIGLLACFLQVFFPKKSKTAKYAGNWDPKASQPVSYKLQRWLLSNRLLTKNMTVLVYGQWGESSKNIRSFFTSTFFKREIAEVKEKEFVSPYLFLFVGNLVSGKQPELVIKLIKELIEAGVHCNLEIYGEGKERQALEKSVKFNNLQSTVKFKGNSPIDVVKEAYQRSHFLILPSLSEGWPKVVAEAMFFGVIPIVTEVSCIPMMLNNGKRGILLPSTIQGNNLEKPVSEILTLLKDKGKMEEMSTAAKAWSQKFTVEDFDTAIKELFT